MKLNKIIIGVSALLVAGATSAWADTVGSVTLTGNVADNISIVVTPQNNPGALDLTVTKNLFVIAKVTEKCNRHGYTVTLESAGALAKGSGTQATLVGAVDTLSYSIQYNGGANLDLLAGKATVTDAGAKTPKDGIEKNLSISYLAADNLTAGDYTDTLTLTLAGK